MSSLHYLFHSLIIRTASILQTSNPQRCFATFIELQVDNSLFQLMITLESSTLGRCLVYECDSSAKDDVSDCQLMSTLSPLKLPTVSTSMLGGSNKQWPCTKVWLQQLPIPALEAWFTSHRSSQRLGLHSALSSSLCDI